MPANRSAPLPPGSFFLKTLGCKANQYESQGLRESLLAAGWQEASAPEDATLMVVNTCIVTGHAAAGCRRFLRTLKARQPAAFLVAAGCAIDAQESWLAELPEIDLLLPNSNKDNLIAWLAGEFAEVGGDGFGYRLGRCAGRTRALLKIQDGCNNRCAYCIVPRARGPARSRPPAEVLAEAERLLTAGHRELILTGITIGAYRSPDGLTLAGLIAALTAQPNLVRLRLSSLEPGHVDAPLLDALAASPAACQHLHLPLQSGDDEVLRAMNRPYTTTEFRNLVARARARLPRLEITTDVIVGFPGETEAAFARTCAFCEEMEFSRLHVFPFSVRPGTPAATLPNSLPAAELAARRDRLNALGEGLAVRRAIAWVGREIRVLAEAGRGALGHTDEYLPADIPGVKRRPGEVHRARVSGTCGPRLIADKSA